MKRIRILLLIVILSMSLVACKDEKVKTETANGDTVKVNVPTDKNEQKQNTSNLNQGDPGERNDIQWWGDWVGEDFCIEITEYDGDSFYFEIMSLYNGKIWTTGSAKIDSNDKYVANCDEISFSLYKDFSAIDFFASENSELEGLGGTYEIIDKNDPYGLTFSSDNLYNTASDPGDTNIIQESDPGDTNIIQGSDPGDTKSLQESDPGNTNDLQWWGTWMGDGFSIEINEYNGSSFWFEIMNLRNGNTILAGTANLYPDNNYMAEFGAISFSLYEDFSAVDLFASESSEWAHLRGHYKHLD